VSGVVRDEVGAPVREALVVIDPDSLRIRARTNDAGRFTMSGVPAGRYEVRVVRIGYRPQSRMIDVTGREVSLEFELRSVPIPLDTVAVRASRPGLYGLVVTRGISLLPHDPRALRGAQVEALNTPHHTRTGADGRFSMPQLNAGAHAIMVTLDGYVTRMIPVSVLPDGGVEITVVLDSLYAEYQRWDEEQNRGIGWRARNQPGRVHSLHEIDLEADLRDGIRYSYALLARTAVTRAIWLNGKPPGDPRYGTDPRDVEALRFYLQARR
jgi:hypothetical protein